MQDVIDILVDEDNKEPILLESADGQRIAFEQIAVIPFEEKLYCILKPLQKLEGMADDEALVFRAEEEDDPPTLVLEQDELTALKIFDAYYKLLEDNLEEE